MENQPTIEEVKKYWEENPLLSIELDEAVGSKNYFVTHEKIRDELEKYVSYVWEFDSSKGKKVLDVGCGPGYLVRNYARNGADICGVDLTEKAVKLTNCSLEIFNLKGKAMVANAEKLPFDSNIFDVVSCAGVLHHTPNISKAIDEIYRVLKPSGKAIISLYYKNIFMSRWLWPITRRLVNTLFSNVKGRGFNKVKDVDDLVRIYDGDENPLGKAYSKKEVLKMFDRFTVLSTGLYYFPRRFLSDCFLYRIIKPFEKFLDKKFGLMIWIKLIKK